MNRTRHLRTGSRDTPVRSATAVSGAVPAVFGAGQDDPRPQRQRLGRGPPADQRLQGITLAIGQQQRDKLRARHASSLLSAKIFRLRTPAAMAQRLLLRRSGSAFLFMHRLLRDYFAGL
jgi:hypothetical protein